MGAVGAILGGSGLATATGAGPLEQASSPNDESENEDSENEDSENDESENDESENEDEGVSKSEVSLSEKKAKDIATAEVSGTVRSVELEREGGTATYEVTVESSGGTVKEVAVHANDGTVLAVETDD